MSRKIWIGALSTAFIACSSLSALAGETTDNYLIDKGSWAELRGDIVGDISLTDGRNLFEVEAPYRAHDAATVPIKITQLDAGPVIMSFKLVIDENPSPVAAEVTLGAGMHPLKFETRVRVNQYSNIRVIADTPEGSFMHGRFVKASGGCSAPATKDPKAALASIGQMRLKLFGQKPAQSTPRREGQIMIRHPNYSGLQRDQITQLFISAHFINRLEVFQGEERLFMVEGGISISENPVFRFDYTDNGADALRVRAEDTEGNIFEKTLPKKQPKSG